MAKEIEVEQRGPLTKKQYNDLNNFLEKNGTFKCKKERVLIDYSTFLDGIEDRKKDFRLRVTNGEPEIILKIGQWGDNESRREISIKTPNNSFDDLVEIFGYLGINRGVLCVRNSIVYDFKGIEFALVEVPDHSYYFEAEILINSQQYKDKAVCNIKAVCEELGLKIFTKQEFFDYIKLLNVEANSVFEFSNYQENYFKNKFSV